MYTDKKDLIQAMTVAIVWEYTNKVIKNRTQLYA